MTIENAQHTQLKQQVTKQFILYEAKHIKGKSIESIYPIIKIIISR